MLHSTVLRKIGSISRRVAYVSNVKFKKYSLQKGQHIFLVRVCEHPGISLAELTRMVDVDKSTTTKAVQKLERDGYLIKEHPEGNLKTFALFPTETAKDIYEEIIREENVRADLCFRGFSAEEKAQFMELLQRADTNMKEYS